MSVAEVVVVLAIVAVIAMLAVAALTRQRESARFAGCQRNLMQIGIGLSLYDQVAGHLPVVAELSSGQHLRAPGPLKSLLEELSLSDLSTLSDRKRLRAKDAGFQVVERTIPSFLCPSDLEAANRGFAAPISYRATTGDDPEGSNGAFAPGRSMSFAEIESRDGLSYTAVFAERVVGDGRNVSFPRNYALVAGPVRPEGCPALPAQVWRGDAGSSWAECSWRSTLYNHGLVPNAKPSCIAEGRRTALMGASSDHVRGVNVLIGDLSVRAFTSTVALKIWREWGNISAPEAQSR